MPEFPSPVFETDSSELPPEIVEAQMQVREKLAEEDAGVDVRVGLILPELDPSLFQGPSIKINSSGLIIEKRYLPSNPNSTDGNKYWVETVVEDGRVTDRFLAGRSSTIH